MPKNSKKLPGEDLDAAEYAAWIILSNILLNLDETITKS